MDTNDQRAIHKLFEKLASVEGQSPPRDAEAEAFIRSEIGRQPGAPYYMAQTIVVQEQALEAAQQRIEELEAQSDAAPGGGGLFGDIFGGNQRPQRSRGSVPPVARGRDQMNSPAGGGFLAGAAQTAMGVAGGILLGNMIGGLFGGSDQAQAQEPSAGDEPGADEAGFDDGGDAGDFGGDF